MCLILTHLYWRIPKVRMTQRRDRPARYVVNQCHVKIFSTKVCYSIVYLYLLKITVSSLIRILSDSSQRRLTGPTLGITSQMMELDCSLYIGARVHFVVTPSTTLSRHSSPSVPVYHSQKYVNLWGCGLFSLPKWRSAVSPLDHSEDLWSITCTFKSHLWVIQMQ